MFYHKQKAAAAAATAALMYEDMYEFMALLI